MLVAFSVILMRRRRTQSFAAAMWLASRSIFLLFAFINNVGWMLVLLAFFWILETSPRRPIRVVQAIYPTRARAGDVGGAAGHGGRHPADHAAGWLGAGSLQLSHHLPVGWPDGYLATVLFARLQVDEGPLPPRETKPISSLFDILRRNRTYALYLLGISIYGFGALLGFALYPIVQVDRLGLSYSQIGLLGLAQSVFWLLGFIIWGKLIDKKGGLWVLRFNCAIGAIIPACYIWADNAWLLLPAFIAQGIVAAGIDLGFINTSIQLAEPDKVVEYSALQTTSIGLRGILAPVAGSLLLRAGMTDVTIFAVGTVLVVASWFVLGGVRIPTDPDERLRRRRELRFRWPLRFRYPRI
ncbi:MAG: MFS transporter [Caldilineaceae bacterium]